MSHKSLLILRGVYDGISTVRLYGLDKDARNRLWRLAKSGFVLKVETKYTITEAGKTKLFSELEKIERIRKGF